jgi:hypothetical protein
MCLETASPYSPSALSRAGIWSRASSWPQRVQNWSVERTALKQLPQLASNWKLHCGQK